MNEGFGHSSELRDVDAKAVVGSPLGQLSQEHDLALNFFDADIDVGDSSESKAHVVQFVVVRRKQRQWPVGRLLVQMFCDGPCDADAVVRACATSDFIEQHQRPRRQPVEDGRRFIHLHHEGRLAAADVVGGTHTGEDAVQQPELGLFGRHKRPGLTQERNKGCLSQEGALARHVGSCDHQHLPAFRVQGHAV